MRIVKMLVVFTFVCGLVAIILLWPWRTVAADSGGGSVPGILLNGFGIWTKIGNPGVVLNAWKRGGLLERDNKVAVESGYLSRVQGTVGNYQSYAVVDSKRLGDNSEIIWLSINFDRGAVFARFLLFRADRDWVVQNMDFNTQPESLMPWLAFEGSNYNQ